MTYKKSKETKNRILTVAKELFYKQGFKDTSLRQICKEANINHSLIYYYFENGKYGIGQFLISEHSRHSIRAVSKYYPHKNNYLLFFLLLLRFQFREINQDSTERENYIAIWEVEKLDRPFLIETYSIAKELKLNVNYNEVKTAVLMSDYVWSGLNEAQQNGSINISDKEIRDLTDITRWTNLGLDKQILLDEIVKAENLLDNIPIHHIHLINLCSGTMKL